MNACVRLYPSVARVCDCAFERLQDCSLPHYEEVGVYKRESAQEYVVAAREGPAEGERQLRMLDEVKEV